MRGVPRKSNKILTAQELRDIQQPLANDGYTNPVFDKLYKNNPFKGTKRDRSHKRSGVILDISAKRWKRIFGN